MNGRSLVLRRAFFSILLLSLPAGVGQAGGKIGIYGIYMTPHGVDAEKYSDPGFGLGAHIVLPVPELYNLFAGTAGFEYVNLMSKTVSVQDSKTFLRVDQETSQAYYRLYIGGQIGGHGNGFLRPHAGINIALGFYHIGTDVVVPDDYDREKEIRQSLSSKTRVVGGYDFTIGLDLNFSNTVALDFGTRYVKSFSVPEQLGEGSVKIYQQYFQIYIGIGAALDWRPFR
jgi:hypothetical protein